MIAADVSPELARKTIAPMHVLGALQARARRKGGIERPHPLTALLVFDEQQEADLRTLTRYYFEILFLKTNRRFGLPQRSRRAEPRDSMEVWQAHTDQWTAPGPLGLPPP